MKKYTVYFEIYGKKLKVTVDSSSAIKAKQAVKDALIFHKIVEQKSTEHDDSVIDFLSDVFGFSK